MAEREQDAQDFSDDELEALVGEERPDRKAMSTVNCDPSELAALGIDEVARDFDPHEA